MKTRPLTVAALLYAGGLLACEQFPLPLVALFSISLALALAALFFPALRLALLCPLVFFLGWTNLAARSAVLSPHDLRTIFGNDVDYVTLEGALRRSPKERLYIRDNEEVWRSMSHVNVTAMQRNGVWEPAHGRVAVSTPELLDQRFFAGQQVQVAGTLRQPRGPAADGLFDYRKFLSRQQIYYQLAVRSRDDWEALESDKRAPLSHKFLGWARTTLSHGLPGEDEALRLRWAMSLGWRAALTDEVAEKFMRSGTMHIFAISGLHIALITLILIALLRVLQTPRAVCGWVVIPLLWFYVAATGWQPSAIRATIMTSLVLAGWSLKRPVDLLNSLGAAAVLILVWEPEQLFQTSFQLSFSVVLSIALVLPIFERVRKDLLKTDPFLPPELRPRWRRLLDEPLNYLTGCAAVSLAAWLGSAPVIAHYFNLVSPVGVVANLAIVSLSFPALASNLGSLICGAWFPSATELFNFSGWFWMRAMIGISEWAAGLPGAYAHVPSPAPWHCAVYYFFLFGALSGAVMTRRRRLVLLVAAAGVMATSVWALNHERKTVRITVLPLSGGEAIVVDAPGRQNDLMIDGGNQNAAEFTVKPFLRSRGFSRVPRLLLTHGDLRHVGGATDLVADFSINEVLMSPVRFRSQAYRAIPGFLEEAGVPVRLIERGDQFGFWTVLHPKADESFPQADDNAVVLRGEIFGTRILLLSDLGRPGQNALLNRSQDVRADIVVSGLPVRGEPLSEAMLHYAQPQVIIITDAEFPATERASRELRQRLAEREIPVFYGRDHGAITIVLGPGRWSVRGADGTVVRGAPKLQSEE